MSTDFRLGENSKKGVIAWMVNNRITPNLLMLVFLIGGLIMSFRVKQEVFPEFALDIVNVIVAYPGAGPEEVEQGIILSVESAIEGIDGIKQIQSTAAEGMGRVDIELNEDADAQKVYEDIKQSIDSITTFPEDAERSVVSLEVHQHEVLTVDLYGNVTEWSLRDVAERVRDELLQDPRISQVEFEGARDYRVYIEVPQQNLVAYGLTLQQIANQIKTGSVEVPGGRIDTSAGEIMLRVTDRRSWAKEFARMPVITSSDGSVVHLDDIASVSEGFEDSDQYASFNNMPSISLAVFRIGKQTPGDVSAATREVLTKIEQDIPEGINWHISHDRSEVYQQRLELLMKNAFMGLALVLIVLGLFLEYRLAFWVTMGIPTSFLGALLFLPVMDVSINMISLFAFIVALGIVVDDAIVAGENIYELRTQGKSFTEAAIQGAKDVGVPISFSILTNIVAFMPLYFIPGHMGKIFMNIPLVVVTTFLISWVEAMFILPSHLAHSKPRKEGYRANIFVRLQQRFSGKLIEFVNNKYLPFLDKSVRRRGLTISIALAILVIVLGYVLGGRIGLITMPRAESDMAMATATLPYGSPVSTAEEIRRKMVDAVETVAEQNGGSSLIEGVFSSINENVVQVRAYLTDPETRPISTGKVSELWRQQVGPIPGLESLLYESDRGGPGSGAALTIELSHRNIDVLDSASAALADKLGEFPNVKDINDGYTPGKQQIDFKLKPEGQSLGLTSSEIGRQVRNAFHGAIAVRQQRENNEIQIIVRLPEKERSSEYDIEQMLLATPGGNQVPLRQVAEIIRGRAFTSISRRDGRRTVQVTANVEPIGETNEVLGTLTSTVMPELLADFPGLSYSYEGRQAEMRESISGLIMAFISALLGIYFLLAIPFRSYMQPLIVMMAIPFGIVGAVLGHLLMGYNLSIMSLMGIVALAGVVVNDSLVLVDYANRLRLAGSSAGDAIREAGVRRFRPVMLTTLTTFGGLSPMILETSRQARFMIPMAISLGFGILFATSITLILIPCLYRLIDDVRDLTPGIIERRDAIISLLKNLILGQPSQL